MTDANGVTVSNGYADNNAPYDVATKTIANKRFQKVILYDGSGNEVTSWTITPSGTQDINLKQVGGVATSLGQAAEASSIPVVLATTQDTAKDGTETAQGQFTGIGVLKAPPFEGNPAWAAWPASDAGIPYVGVWGYDESSQAFRNINAHTTSYTVNGASLIGLLTRSLLQGVYSGNTSDTATAYVANTTPGASDYGIVARIIPSGTQNIAITAVSATVPAYGKIAGSSLTTSYQTVLTMGGAAKILQIWNSTEVPVIFSYDGGTTANIELGPYESESVDYAANGMTLASGTIQAKLVSGSAPVNGGSVRAKVTR